LRELEATLIAPASKVRFAATALHQHHFNARANSDRQMERRASKQCAGTTVVGALNKRQSGQPRRRSRIATYASAATLSKSADRAAPCTASSSSDQVYFSGHASPGGVSSRFSWKAMPG